MKKVVKVTIDGVQFRLTSEEQLDLLSKRVVKFLFPVDWKDQKRIDGLEAKGFFQRTVSTSKSVTYKRTDLGSQVYKQISSRP